MVSDLAKNASSGEGGDQGSLVTLGSVNSSELIDALRGLAALMVVLFHVRVDLWVGLKEVLAQPHLPPWIRYTSLLSVPTMLGGAGVMLFFILSGFCIGLPYVGPKGHPFAFWSYFKRRFWRIYPPYFAALALSAVIDVITLSVQPSGFDTGAYTASAFMLQNYLTGQVPSNPSLWSLPVELELYLVFPLLWICLQQARGRVWAWTLAAVVSLLGFAGHMQGWGWCSGNFAKYWVIWTAGLLLADAWRRGQIRKVSLVETGVAAVGLAVGVIGELNDWGDAGLPFAWAAFFYILFKFLLAHETVINPFLAGKPHWLCSLGTISYSLYLVHFPFFKLLGFGFVNLYGSKPVSYGWCLAACLLVIPVAALFYKCVELPSHAFAKRMGASRKS